MFEPNSTLFRRTPSAKVQIVSLTASSAGETMQSMMTLEVLEDKTGWRSVVRVELR
jgi:hypothetical protein